jgi:2-keto-4-pentenoate hydratase
VGRDTGAALMGNPINVVMWMAQRLKKDGITLKPGEMLDLGGYINPGPMENGSTVTVKYLGFPGNPTVTAHFE